MVHTKGVGLWFQVRRKASMCRRSAAFEGKLARLMERRVMMLKKPSTWFNQEALVGVKWKTMRGCAASHS